MNPLFTCEERILSRVARHRHNDLVEDVPRAVDHIEVAISNRVEGPRIDTNFHNDRDSVHLRHEVQHINLTALEQS